MQCFIGTILLIMLCFGPVFACSASESKPGSDQDQGILLAVIDKSKEPYGIQLQDEVLAQLKKQLKTAVTEDNEIKGKSDAANEIAKAEQPELLKLAERTSSRYVLVVEILPVKSDLSEFLFYKSIKSEVTLKVRLLDAERKEYILHEEVAGTGTNKTFIPYTSVGKKVTVRAAVQKAADIAAQKINQTAEDNR